MASTPPEAAKGGAKKVGKGLTKKLGPLPLWAWLGIAAGGAIALYMLTRGRGAGEADSPAELVTGNRTLPAEDTAMGGGPSTGTSADSMLSPDVLEEIRSNEAATSYALKNIGEHLNDPSYWGVDDSTSLASDLANLNDSVAALVAATTLSPPATAAATATQPVTKKPARPAGVKWGGHTFQTKAEMARWLNVRGASWSVFQQRHPEAARQLTGPAPIPSRKGKKPAAKPAAVRKTPVVVQRKPIITRPAPRQSPPKKVVKPKAVVKKKAPAKQKPPKAQVRSRHGGGR